MRYLRSFEECLHFKFVQCSKSHEIEEKEVEFEEEGTIEIETDNDLNQEDFIYQAITPPTFVSLLSPFGVLT